MKLQAHRSGKFDDSDFLWHGLAFEIRILSPLHHSSFSPWFSSLSLNLCLARAHRGSYRYVLLGDLIGLDLSTKSAYVLHSTVPSLLLQLQLILLGRFPLLVRTRPGGLLLLLGVAFYHLQACLDIGTWCRGLSAAVGREGGALVRIL